ncbi:hypothetical protein HK102_003048, partial [Quaeritorhiza haematococci]
MEEALAIGGDNEKIVIAASLELSHTIKRRLGCALEPEDGAKTSTKLSPKQSPLHPSQFILPDARTGTIQPANCVAIPAEPPRNCPPPPPAAARNSADFAHVGATDAVSTSTGSRSNSPSKPLNVEIAGDDFAIKRSPPKQEHPDHPPQPQQQLQSSKQNHSPPVQSQPPQQVNEGASAQIGQQQKQTYPQQQPHAQPQKQQRPPQRTRRTSAKKPPPPPQPRPKPVPAGSSQSFVLNPSSFVDKTFTVHEELFQCITQGDLSDKVKIIMNQTRTCIEFKWKNPRFLLRTNAEVPGNLDHAIKQLDAWQTEKLKIHRQRQVYNQPMANGTMMAPTASQVPRPPATSAAATPAATPAQSPTKPDPFRKDLAKTTPQGNSRKQSTQPTPAHSPTKPQTVKVGNAAAANMVDEDIVPIPLEQVRDSAGTAKRWCVKNDLDAITNLYDQDTLVQLLKEIEVETGATLRFNTGVCRVDFRGSEEAAQRAVALFDTKYQELVTISREHLKRQRSGVAERPAASVAAPNIYERNTKDSFENVRETAKGAEFVAVPPHPNVQNKHSPRKAGATTDKDFEAESYTKTWGPSFEMFEQLINGGRVQGGGRPGKVSKGVITDDERRWVEKVWKQELETRAAALTERTGVRCYLDTCGGSNAINWLVLFTGPRGSIEGAYQQWLKEVALSLQVVAESKKPKPTGGIWDEISESTTATTGTGQSEDLASSIDTNGNSMDDIRNGNGEQDKSGIARSFGAADGADMGRYFRTEAQYGRAESGAGRSNQMGQAGNTGRSGNLNGVRYSKLPRLPVEDPVGYGSSGSSIESSDDDYWKSWVPYKEQEPKDQPRRGASPVKNTYQQQTQWSGYQQQQQQQQQQQGYGGASRTPSPVKTNVTGDRVASADSWNVENRWTMPAARAGSGNPSPTKVGAPNPGINLSASMAATPPHNPTGIAARSAEPPEAQVPMTTNLVRRTPPRRAEPAQQPHQATQPLHPPTSSSSTFVPSTSTSQYYKVIPSKIVECSPALFATVEQEVEFLKSLFHVMSAVAGAGVQRLGPEGSKLYLLTARTENSFHRAARLLDDALRSASIITPLPLRPTNLPTATTTTATPNRLHPGAPTSHTTTPTTTHNTPTTATASITLTVRPKTFCTVITLSMPPEMERDLLNWFLGDFVRIGGVKIGRVVCDGDGCYVIMANAVQALERAIGIVDDKIAELAGRGPQSG